ncbi:hypothetical protein [Dactylosporangium sp. NPDC051541]|uniref:hypothetical protein n=1 Tax=Dactylosporangium sp. NPDC051541 TaxID=3363977 RepID=UPI0037A29605
MALVGYTVEAKDGGRIGAIDRDTRDGRAVYVQVEAGGRVKLDVNTVERIDHRAHKVYLTVPSLDLTPN